MYNFYLNRRRIALFTTAFLIFIKIQSNMERLKFSALKDKRFGTDREKKTFWNSKYETKA